MSDDEIRKAMRDQKPQKDNAEVVLSSVKLVLDAQGVFSIVIDQVERRNMVSFLNSIDPSLYDEIMYTFDEFNRRIRDVQHYVSVEG